MLGALKKAFHQPSTRLANVELGSLLHGGMRIEEQDVLDRRYGHHHRIELRDLPHYTIWRDAGEAGADAPLRELLHCSADADAVERSIADYRRLHDQIRARGAVEQPIELTPTPDGRLVILDGVRRASIAYSLGLDVPCVQRTQEDGLRQIVDNRGEFYGTRNADRPYQSIFYKERELLPGRRRDILERFHKLRIIEDIRGKDVLDVGSNIAVNAMTAWHFGARSVTAMEYSPTIATSALRLAAVLDAQLRLIVQDLGAPVTTDRQFDTVFCFSLHAHVKDKQGLESNLLRVTRRVLYFEGHENSTAADYEHVLRHFAEVQPLGFNRDGEHSTASTRPFFRCVR